MWLDKTSADKMPAVQKSLVLKCFINTSETLNWKTVGK